MNGLSKTLKYHPLTPNRWLDFERLFGDKGAYGGCWCMWWRISRSEFERQQGEGNKKAMKQIVASGEVPGILLYSERMPVAWCSVAPRKQFATLNRSRVLKPIDDQPVWSIVCFFVGKVYQKQGITIHLIQAAIDYVRKQGGRIVEAYPNVPRSDRVPPFSSFMGFPSMFKKAGFVECGRPSKSKVVMRYYIE